ncbi:MAG: class II aldolase [Lentisphaerae bacterium]|nr:class II aldolase [Lentisphaerota bacterium]
MVNTALSQLIRISNVVGKDSALVQGVGGNTSVKTDDGRWMYIKASGTALKDMNGRRGWCRVNREAVESIFTDRALAGMDVSSRELEMVKRLQAACDDGTTAKARPSVECPLHVLLDTCVIHLHALVTLAYASAREGKARLFDLFSDASTPPLWVPYADPGYSLGQKAYRLVARYERECGCKPTVMFLEKHGLLVAADSPDKALRRVRQVVKRCSDGLSHTSAHTVLRVRTSDAERVQDALSQALAAVCGEASPVHHFVDKTVSAVLARDDVAQLVKAPPLTPDEMGFVSSPVLYLETTDPQAMGEKVAACVARRGKPPVAFLVRGYGLFIAGEPTMAGIVRDIVVGSLFVRSHAQDMGGINGLNKRQRGFIDNWEAEKFRVQLAVS